MGIFEIISKINSFFGFLNLLKKMPQFVLLISLLIISLIAISCYGIFNAIDNSIHIANIEHIEIKKDVKYILEKCGNKHSIGLSTVSTIAQGGYDAEWKEFWACDFKINKQNCLIDLTALEKYNHQKIFVDKRTYEFLSELSKKDDISKFTLDSNLSYFDDYQVVKDLIQMSDHQLNTLWLTAIENSNDKVIYTIHMASWSDTPCPDGRYLINKLKKKLPKSKLWL